MTNPLGGRPIVPKTRECKSRGLETVKRDSGLCHTCESRKKKFTRPPAFVMTKEISADIERHKREIAEMRGAGVLYKWIEGDNKGEVYR